MSLSSLSINNLGSIDLMHKRKSVLANSWLIFITITIFTPILTRRIIMPLKLHNKNYFSYLIYIQILNTNFEKLFETRKNWYVRCDTYMVSFLTSTFNILIA